MGDIIQKHQTHANKILENQAIYPKVKNGKWRGTIANMNEIIPLLRSERPSSMCAKLCTMAASNNRVHPTRSLYCCLFMPHIYCCSFCTFRSWWTAHSGQRQQSGCNNIPSFLQEPHRSHVLCVKACTWHDPHILVTASFCCDRKARVACVQSFAQWQQATIEFTWRDHSIIACSHCIYIGVVLHAHSIRGEPRIQGNASRVVAIPWNFHWATYIYYRNIDVNLHITIIYITQMMVGKQWVKSWGMCRLAGESST